MQLPIGDECIEQLEELKEGIDSLIKALNIIRHDDAEYSRRMTYLYEKGYTSTQIEEILSAVLGDD